MPHLPYRELPVAEPGVPDRRSALRYLLWLARHQRVLLTANALFGVGWMLAQALLWAAVGAAIDRGVARHDGRALLAWVGVVMGLGLVQAVCGALRHQLAVTNWMNASYRTIQVVGRHLSQAGTAVAEEIPSGDVVNTVASDAMRIGGAFDVTARFIGAIVAWAVVAVILLRASTELGLVVLLGVPVLASITTPLMRPLHASQAAQREAAGRLAALGADTVAGLRILRGVGGEEVFLDGYRRQSEKVRLAGNRIARPQAALESGQVLLPALLTALVTYLGAREVMAGRLSAGQLVAFFGYATFLTTPLRTAVEYVIATTRAYVGATKVLRLLDVPVPLSDPEEPRDFPSPVEELVDQRSGLRLARGELVALVTETPAEAAVLADRLGRFDADSAGVLVNGVPVESLRVADIRAHIVVGEIEPRLFSGPLREELSPRGAHDDVALWRALEAASALDAVSSLDGGLAGQLEERGRGLSGGQRQRLVLARALLSEAEVLILVEPTSAVDTHTEGRIASTLRGARAGSTTLVATTSPLLLERCDRVVVVSGGHLVAEGRHTDLLASSALYRQIVLREEAS